MTDRCPTCDDQREIPANTVARVWGDTHPWASFAPCPDCAADAPTDPSGDAS